MKEVTFFFSVTLQDQTVIFFADRALAKASVEATWGRHPSSELRFDEADDGSFTAVYKFTHRSPPTVVAEGRHGSIFIHTTTQRLK